MRITNLAVGLKEITRRSAELGARLTCGGDWVMAEREPIDVVIARSVKRRNNRDQTARDNKDSSLALARGLSEPL